jgi:signal transduction histidine kinase
LAVRKRRAREAGPTESGGLSGVDRVSAVARALTATTGGVPALQREVVRTAAALAGDGATAAMALRDRDHLTLVSLDSQEPVGVMEGWERSPDVLAGGRVGRVVAGEGSLLVLPMFFRGEVVGALAVLSPPGAAPRSDDTEDVLASLAGNAAIAMENARLYEQERETVRRLRELDTMKTDFLSTVQHEMRTPLTAILGLSDLIEMCWDTWEDPSKLDALRDIQVAAKNLDSIVETIIDFSAVDGEALVLALADMLLEPAARAAVETIGERHKGGLPVPAEVVVDPGITVLADPDRFGQVMRALIDNAVKFSDGRGRVVVNGRRTDGGVVVVEVVDQGIGIPDADLPHVFDRFFQADNTSTRRFGGTGMGLALVKRIVDAHGATITVETRVGAGTRIVLRWPERVATGAELAGEPPGRSSVPVQ